MSNYYHDDLGDVPRGGARARQLLFARAGLAPADIDVADDLRELQPARVPRSSRRSGFCGPGEAKDFIADGNIDLGGTLPVNTHGGLLGEAYIHGMNNILEGVRQVRGTAVNQVPTVERVLVSSLNSGLVLGRV